MQDTIPRVLEAAADAWGPRPAMKFRRDDKWESISWEEYCRDVRLAARGLMALGLEVGRGVVIIGYNRPEWFIANQAAMAAGGIPAGIYTTSTPQQCAYIATHSEAQIAIVENTEQLEKFRAERENFPEFHAIVLMEGTDPDENVITFDELISRSSEVSPETLDARLAELKPEALATLIYTSGTTGPPKAVMLSHRNLVWTAAISAEALEVGPDDQLISYLPLSHIAEQIATHHISLRSGACVAFAESLEKLGENLRDIQPTVFLGVPRVWEKIQAGIQMAGAEVSGLKKKITGWAKGVGLAGGYSDQKGHSKPALYGLADKLVFSKVRDRLGFNRIRYCITSAAPISLDTLEFFLSLGIPIMEVYGLSECTGPATVSLPDRYRTGSVGVAAPETEVVVADDGELLIRGPHVFMGYYKDERATRATLDDRGWLHTGDIGTIDELGFIRITDRKKDILITAGGKNVAPQNLEGHLKSIPVVAQAVIIGDRKPYLSALLTLDESRVPQVAHKIGSNATNAIEAASCTVFNAYLRAEIDKIDAKLSRAETIKKFVILPADFSIEGGELTPTMKIKRNVVRDRYAKEIETLYG